MKQNFKYHR